MFSVLRPAPLGARRAAAPVAKLLVNVPARLFVVLRLIFRRPFVWPTARREKLPTLPLRARLVLARACPPVRSRRFVPQSCAEIALGFEKRKRFFFLPEARRPAALRRAKPRRLFQFARHRALAIRRCNLVRWTFRLPRDQIRWLCREDFRSQRPVRMKIA